MLSKQMETGSIYTVSGSSDTSSMRTPEPSMMNNNNGHSSSHRYRNKVKWDDESSVNTQESSNDSPMVSALSALRVNTTYNTTNINNKGNAAHHKNKVEIASRTKSEEATESNLLLKSKQNMRRGKESAFSAIRRVTNNIDTKKINQSARLRAMERHLAEMEKNGLLIDETTSSSTHDDLEVSDDSSDDEDENQNNSHKENRPVVAKPKEHSSVIATKANNRNKENDVSDNVMINKSSVEERTTLSSTARNVNNLVKEGNATEHKTEQDSYLFSPAAFAAAVTAIAATNVTDTATHTAITTNASADKTDLTKPTTLDVSHNNNNNNSINYNSNGDTNHGVDGDVNNDELECVREVLTCDITRPTTEESNNNVTSEQNESENTSDRASISFSHLKPQESLLNPNRVEESVRAIKKINEQMHADILKRKMEKEQSITEEEIEKVKHEVLREHRRNSRNRASTGNTNNSNYDIDYNSDNDDNDDNEHHTLHINPMRFSIKPNYIPVTPRDLRRMSSNSQLIHPHAHQEEILQHVEKTTLHNGSNMDQSEHTQDFSEANTIKNGNTIDNNNSGSSSNNHNSKSITKSNDNDAEDHNFSANLESSVNEALTYSSKECGNHTTISLHNDAHTREVSTHTNALGPGKTNTKSETSKENDGTDIVAHQNSVEDKNTIDSNKHHEKKVKERLISVPNAGRNVFWFRPESAPYEMTESIAAKRRTLPERTNTQMETRTSLHSGRITQGSVHRPESIGRASMNIPVHAAHNITKSDGCHDNNNNNNSNTSSNNMNSDNDKKKEKKKSISAKTEEGSVENAKVNMFTSPFERQSSTLSTPTAKSSRRSSGLIRRTGESSSFIKDKEKFVTERRQSLQSVNGRLLSRCSSVSSLSMTSRQELSLQKHYTRLNSSRSQLSDMISSVSSDSSYAANKPVTRYRYHNNSNSNNNNNNNNNIKRKTREIGKGALATATQKANRENEVHGNEDANNTNSNVAASSSITPVSTPEKNGINDKTRNVRNESSIPPLPRSPSKKMLATTTPLKNDTTIVEISTLEDHDVMRKSKARLSMVAPEQLVDNEISSVDVTPYSIATPSQLNSANQSAGKVDVSVIRQQLINSLKTEQSLLVNTETPLRRLNEEQEFQTGESVAVADNNNNNNNKNNDNNGSNTRINDSILSSSKTNDNNNHTSSNNNIGSSHNRSDLLYKKELMVSVLQGLAQQTRHVLPCYLCGDMQHIVSYKHHIAVCRPRTLALLDEYEQTHGSEENPASANENNATEKELTNNESTAIADRQLFYDNEKRRAAIEAVEELYIPTQKSSYEEKTRFSHACLHCASALLVQCKKCKMLLRIEDVRQHECQCGLSYYSSSKNCHRIRAAAERIVNSLSEIEQSDVIAN